MTAALADGLGNFVLTIAELVHQRAIAFSLFESIEIGALHVFNDGDLQRFGIGRFDDDGRNLMQTRPLRRAPAALAGNNFVGVGSTANLSDNDRLDDPALA